MNKTYPAIFLLLLSLSSCKYQKFTQPYHEDHLQEMIHFNDRLNAKFDPIQDCTLAPPAFEDCLSEDHCDEILDLWQTLGLFSVCKHYIYEDSSQHAFVYTFARKQFDRYHYESKLVWCPESDKVDSLVYYHGGGMETQSKINDEWTYVVW